MPGAEIQLHCLYVIHSISDRNCSLYIQNWIFKGNAVEIRDYEQWTLKDDGLILQSLGYYGEAEYIRQLTESP